MPRSFPFTTRDGRAGIVREAASRDARATLAISWETMRERPRTLAVTEEEFWTPHEWRRHRIPWSDRGATIVAEVADDLVGTLTIQRHARPVIRHAAEIGILVAARARGIGVGTALMRTAETWAAESGVSRLTLGVFKGNERAYALYRSLGYEEEGMEIRGVRFPDGDVDVIRMVKFPGAGPSSRSVRATEYDASTSPTREERDG